MVVAEFKKKNQLTNFQTFVGILKESGKDTVIPAITSVLDYVSTIKDWGFEKLSPVNKYGIVKISVSAAECFYKTATNQSSLEEESKKLAKEVIITAIDTAGGNIGALCADTLVTITGHPTTIPLVHGAGFAAGNIVTHQYSPEIADKLINLYKEYEIEEKISSAKIYLTEKLNNVSNSMVNIFNLSSN